MSMVAVGNLETRGIGVETMKISEARPGSVMLFASLGLSLALAGGVTADVTVTFESGACVSGRYSGVSFGSFVGRSQSDSFLHRAKASSIP